MNPTQPIRSKTIAISLGLAVLAGALAAVLLSGCGARTVPLGETGGESGASTT